MPVDEYLEQRLRLKYYWRFTPGVPDLHIDTHGYDSNDRPEYLEQMAFAKGYAFSRGRAIANLQEFRVCTLNPDEHGEIDLLLDHQKKEYY